jgi:hypothetical protein
VSLEHNHPVREERPKRGRRPPEIGLDVTDRWLTRRQAAEYLGLEPQTLAHDAVHGRLAVPYAKFGRVCRYRLSRLVEWSEAREVGARTP